MNISTAHRTTKEMRALGETIYSDITQLIGRTPLVQLSRLAAHFSLTAEIIGKIEYFNPTGSVKRPQCLGDD